MNKFWLKYNFSYILDLFVGSMFGAIDIFLIFIVIGGIGDERVDYFCDSVKRIIIAEGMSPLILAFLLMQILFFAEQFFFTPTLNKLYDEILAKTDEFTHICKTDLLEMLKGYDAESLTGSVENGEFYTAALEAFSEIERNTDRVVDKYLFDAVYKRLEDNMGEEINKMCQELCEALQIGGDGKFTEKMKKEMTACASERIIEKIIFRETLINSKIKCSS